MHDITSELSDDNSFVIKDTQADLHIIDGVPTAVFYFGESFIGDKGEDVNKIVDFVTSATMENHDREAALYLTVPLSRLLEHFTDCHQLSAAPDDGLFHFDAKVKPDVDKAIASLKELTKRLEETRYYKPSDESN